MYMPFPSLPSFQTFLSQFSTRPILRQTKVVTSHISPRPSLGQTKVSLHFTQMRMEGFPNHLTNKINKSTSDNYSSTISQRLMSSVMHPYFPKYANPDRTCTSSINIWQFPSPRLGTLKNTVQCGVTPKVFLTSRPLPKLKIITMSPMIVQEGTD